MAKGLSPKRKRFVEEYLIDLNGAAAAVRAGYSARSAAQRAAELLADPRVQEEIQVAVAARSERTKITQDMVLQELAKIGFSDIRRVVRWGDTTITVDMAGGKPEERVYHGLVLTASDKIDADAAGAIAEISEGKEGLKVKMYDKRAALVDMGRHLGMFVERVDHTTKGDKLPSADPAVINVTVG